MVVGCEYAIAANTGGDGCCHRRVLNYDGTALDRGTVLPLAAPSTSFGTVALGDADTLTTPVVKLLEGAAWLSKNLVSLRNASI